jgi:hypothetical protein
MAATQAPVPDERADRHALAAFVVDNPDLERLEGLLAQFNIFDAFGMRRQELRHSDLLAFLLDPRQTHGLGDAFVTRLLQRVLMTSNLPSPAVSPVDLAVWSLDRLLVRREWHYIDLLLVDEEHRLVVIIENKTGSGEIPDQLKCYMKTVQKHYPGWKLLAFYLTPDGSLPTHEDYVPVGYRLVCDVIEDLADGQQPALDPAVPMLLSHYARMLRRHVVADSEIADLCRTIYRKHQRALDLIYEHRPDDQDTMRDFLVDLVTSRDDLVLDQARKVEILFTVREWAEVPQLKQGVGWTPSGRMPLFGFWNKPKELSIGLVIGPGPQEIRNALANRAREAGPPLGVKGKQGQQWTTIFSQHMLDAREYEVLTVREREDRVRERWHMFLDNDLPKIRAGLSAADLAVEFGDRVGS